MSVVKSFVTSFAAALRQQDAHALAMLVRLQQSRSLAQSVHGHTNVSSLCDSALEEGWATVAAHHIMAAAAWFQQDYAEAVSQQGMTLVSFKLVLRSENRWLLPVLYVLCSDLRHASVQADIQRERESKKPIHMEDAARKLNDMFAAIQDRAPLAESKKWGTLHIVNNLFKLYFRMNNFNMCKPLTRRLDAAGFPAVSEFPVSHVVTFRYYTGRLHLFEGRYAEAEEDLTEAFNRCTRHHHRNKKLSLSFLIPARLVRGVLPRATLLRKYGLQEYVGICNSIRSGNVAEFNTCMQRYAVVFRQRGLYLLVETLRFLVYRTLVVRVHKIVSAAEPKKPFELRHLQRALALLGVDMDMDEVECIVVNLIFRKYVRGYVAPAHHVLVLSLKNPFPSLSTVVR